MHIFETLRAMNNVIIILPGFPTHLKLVSAIFLSNFYFSPDDGPSKNMKNVFYFI